MNRRTRLLIGAMAIIGVAVIGDKAYRSFVEEPGEQLDRELNRIQKQIRGHEDAIFDAVAAGDQVAALEQFSLPYDSEMARARYQDWLLELVEGVDLQQASVDAGTAIAVKVKDRDTRKPKEIFKRYPFSLRGRGSLSQVTTLLYQFYQGGHLHKITSVSLNPVAGGSKLDINLGVEALGLTRCEREEELSKLAFNRLQSDQLANYDSIVKRNLFFSRGEGALQKVVLTAITFDRSGVPAAWFSVGGDQPTRVVRRDEKLKVEAYEIEVLDIHPQLALIQVDGAVIKLPLGKSVHEMTAPLAKVEH